MMGVRRAAAILGLLVIVLSLATGTSDAKRHKKGHAWASGITLVNSAPTAFDGKVSSKLGACRSQRLVTIYYTDPQTGQTQPLSVQRTANDGRYQVSLTTPAYAGTYQAQVSKQRIRAQDAPQTCRGAKSAVVRI
jgi:hypothetical protein